MLRTWGSSPRPVGSILALAGNGSVVGSVSGGCIEDDLIERCVRPDTGDLLHSKVGAPVLLTYGITSDEAHRFGLPCGGTLELLVERNPPAASLDDLVGRLEAGGLTSRQVALRDGTVTLSSIGEPQQLHVTKEHVSCTFGPEYRMLLIGAGQLTQYVATMAEFNGFSVTVCDPRAEYRSSWNVPGAVLVNGMPDDVVAEFGSDRRSVVIALTHDPKLDDLALLEAVKSEAFYVGAIGSRRNSTSRRERLAEHFDVTPSELARLRGPVGLFIDSKTPAEIAVSIMAEVLAVKNGVDVPRAMQVSPAKRLLEEAALGD